MIFSLQDIVTAMRINNLGRSIDASRVMGFLNRAAANAFMVAAYGQVTGVVHFDVTNPPHIGYTLQINTTVCFLPQWRCKICGDEWGGQHPAVTLPLCSPRPSAHILPATM